jgi:NAD(P)-dependent dehydrogenase (short-subunit alcohol dehydrogenase family)
MKTFLITGANSGIGLEAARQLVGQGNHVVMAVRDRGRGEAARADIARQFPRAEIDLVTVDLSDLDSVRALGETRPKLDVLINNAGVGTAPLKKTREGVYLQFGANHLGHFILTGLLFPQLELSSDPRVVTVSSGFGRRGKLDLENLDASRGYSQGRAYAQSKLANALFAAELDRRLRVAGSRVKSVVAHPGIAATPLQQKPTGAVGVLSRTISALLGRPAANGALPTVLAATGSDVRGGEVYGPGKGKTAPARREERWPSFDDLEGARMLWERSEELTRMKWLP